jgi:hypothetical protein
MQGTAATVLPEEKGAAGLARTSHALREIDVRRIEGRKENSEGSSQPSLNLQ